MLDMCMAPHASGTTWTLIDFLSRPLQKTSALVGGHGRVPGAGTSEGQAFGASGATLGAETPELGWLEGGCGFRQTLTKQRAHVGVSIKYPTNRFPTNSLKLKTRDSKHCLIDVGSLGVA
ncbi:unnamed protein product [Effrenium voratum]|uniref:Uncharacterized protein n=1 Tax=Effrenium voratum TaxID=2562239 RepID=A0AA36NCZ7_9DINO|nr:unnamed protein product [Effrenium voratum]